MVMQAVLINEGGRWHGSSSVEGSAGRTSLLATVGLALSNNNHTSMAPAHTGKYLMAILLQNYVNPYDITKAFTTRIDF
jgi:hypothetical protein